MPSGKSCFRKRTLKSGIIDFRVPCFTFGLKHAETLSTVTDEVFPLFSIFRRGARGRVGHAPFWRVDFAFPRSDHDNAGGI